MVVPKHLCASSNPESYHVEMSKIDESRGHRLSYTDDGTQCCDHCFLPVKPCSGIIRFKVKADPFDTKCVLLHEHCARRAGWVW